MRERLRASEAHDLMLARAIRAAGAGYSGGAGPGAGIPGLGGGQMGGVHAVSRQVPAPLRPEGGEDDGDDGEEILNGFVDRLILGGAWTWAGPVP